MVSPEQILNAYRDLGLFEISVAVLRAAGYTVTYEPAGGVDHGAVWGMKDKPKSVLRKLCPQILRVWSPDDQSLVLDRTAEASEPAT
jgi:hypothetical protein